MTHEIRGINEIIAEIESQLEGRAMEIWTGYGRDLKVEAAVRVQRGEVTVDGIVAEEMAEAGEKCRWMHYTVIVVYRAEGKGKSWPAVTVDSTDVILPVTVIEHRIARRYPDVAVTALDVQWCPGEYDDAATAAAFDRARHVADAYRVQLQQDS